MSLLVGGYEREPREVKAEHSGMRDLLLVDFAGSKGAGGKPKLVLRP